MAGSERDDVATGDFPFERVPVTGEQALSTWERTKAAASCCPVIIGDDASVGLLMVHFDPKWPRKRSLADVLAAAATIRHPQDLNVKRRPHLGTWPSKPESLDGPSVASDHNGPKRKVYIGLIETDDWTTIPAHLRYGGWDACPPAEYHVAALRSWRDRYVAELVGLDSHKMDVRVTHRPQSRAEALDLAHEHYAYCSDIVDQGFGTLAKLAACLMANDWWGFWWD
jgi:Domain of unknown function (DUF4253)